MTCPELADAARERGITSVVHFTRINGLKGILASSAIKSRDDLPEDAYVKHVYEPNAADRSRDWPWHTYVNLSISIINLHMFKHSKRWHKDDKWVILEFGPEILSDDGVVFCTTNNAYPTVHRAIGSAGFEQMFAPEVPWGYHGSTNTRDGRQPHETTDPQAEVLYPFELSLQHLHTITADEDSTRDAVDALLANLWNLPDEPKIKLDPKAFR
ncbi:MAG: DarT ssDNA thymidine ADP-ribosyltransferase family protein [Acidimicrobiaceae bacterium]|nr:DarT ssDNA thymidine ADP-ribosyltransferase family protein [Acidimicrobiaceae bacterium]